MKFEYNTLLNLIPLEGREQLSELAQQLFENEQARETGDAAKRSAADSRRGELLDKLLESIQWHFRAERRPLPSREEIAEMVKEHFQKEQ